MTHGPKGVEWRRFLPGNPKAGTDPIPTPVRLSNLSVAAVLERELHPTQLLVLSFAAAIFGGAALLMTPWATTGPPLGFVDALFTATSATCVTGLVVVDTGTAFTRFGQGVILALIQLGGLGIMTYSSVFLLLAGRGLSFRGEALVEETLGRKHRTSPRRLVRDVFRYTMLIEAAGAAVLYVAFRRVHPWDEALWSAVFHSVSAFCNAGFSLYATSFVAFRGDWLLNLTIMLLITLGGLGFLVLEDLADAWADRRAGRPARLGLHTKVVLATSAVLTFGGAAGVWFFEAPNTLAGLPWHEQVLASLFQSVTARTAGFNTLDYGSLTNTTLFFTILLMFIGASPGSCGGGIKTTTFAVVTGLFRDRLRARERVSLFRRTLPEATVARAVSLLMASFAFVTLVIFALLATEIGPVPHRSGGGTFLEIFFEAVSAFGTVGLSTGITPTLSTAGRLLVTFTMFVGRVGPLTLAIAVGRKREPGRFLYAEENLMVG
ncbi:TrkH family potassium uptake protein [Deferrisoma palaeochoriense]